MTSVGAYLRELRERRGVPLAEIAHTTRVASRYLEALETDTFHALPPAVFTRGFIRAYCQALHESPEEALARYDARPGAPPPAARRPEVSAPSRVARREPRSRSAVIASLILLVVMGMALFTVALLLQPRERNAGRGGEARWEPEPTPAPDAAAPEPAAGQPASPAGGPSPALPAAPASAPLPTASPPSPAVPARDPSSRPGAAAPVPAPSPAASPPAAATPAPVWTGPGLEALGGGVASPYRLVARTSEATWIRVRTEDGRSSEETVPAGEVREWVSDRPFVLTIGNAGGVSFELNGRTLPPLGGRGAVIPRLVLPPEAR